MVKNRWTSRTIRLTRLIVVIKPCVCVCIMRKTPFATESLGHEKHKSEVKSVFLLYSSKHLNTHKKLLKTNDEIVFFVPMDVVEKI